MNEVRVILNNLCPPFKQYGHLRMRSNRAQLLGIPSYQSIPMMQTGK